MVTTARLRLIMIKLGLKLAFICLLFAVLAPLQAQQQAPTSVARVSLTNGNVAAMRGDSGDWVAAAVNTPVVIGDTISTAGNSRAEVQLDEANVVRLSQNAQVKIADLTTSHIQLQVSAGVIDYVVLRQSNAAAEIDTPSVAIHPFGDGAYRIEASNSGETAQTVLVVRRGQAQVSTAEGSTNVQAGQLITIQGTDNPQYQTGEAPPLDSWDQWNNNRDRAILNAQSWQHASSYYVGANDLDRYGRWVYVTGYGWVWQPYTQGPNWAPYRAGRWVWEPYWGWTWVSYEPWGWAPYHYGRWFVAGGAWCWWPGPVTPVYRPIYAPAYVSFFGFGFGGRNWSFGAGFGYSSLGWLPVGPSDRYYPWAGYRNTYTAVNITRITNITNVTNVRNVEVVQPLARANQPEMSNIREAMTNERVRQGLSSATTEQFVRGEVPRQPQTVQVAQLRQAQLVAGTPPAVPTKASLAPTNRAVSPAFARRPGASQTHFFTNAHPPAGPQPFNERAAALRQMVQERRNPTSPAAPPVASGPRGFERSSRSAQPSEPRPGWRTFGNNGNAARANSKPRYTPEPPSQNRERQAEHEPSNRQSQEARGAKPGWHRFGDEHGPQGKATHEKSRNRKNQR